jgi:hypothetical protein
MFKNKRIDQMEKDIRFLTQCISEDRRKFESLTRYLDIIEESPEKVFRKRDKHEHW